jgi:hypothetical protein
MQLDSFKNFYLVEMLKGKPIDVIEDSDLTEEIDMLILNKDNYKEFSEYRTSASIKLSRLLESKGEALVGKVTHSGSSIYYYFLKLDNVIYLYAFAFNLNKGLKFVEHAFFFFRMIDLKTGDIEFIQGTTALQKFEDKRIGFKVYGTVISLFKREMKRYEAERIKIKFIYFSASADKTKLYDVFKKLLERESGYVDAFDAVKRGELDRRDLPMSQNETGRIKDYLLVKKDEIETINKDSEWS